MTKLEGWREMLNFVDRKNHGRFEYLGYFWAGLTVLKIFWSAYFVPQCSYQACEHLLRDVGQFRFRYFAKCYSVENLYSPRAVRSYQICDSLRLLQLTISHKPQVHNYIFRELFFAHFDSRPPRPARRLLIFRWLFFAQFGCRPSRFWWNFSFLQYILCELVCFVHQPLSFLFFAFIYWRKLKVFIRFRQGDI